MHTKSDLKTIRKSLLKPLPMRVMVLSTLQHLLRKELAATCRQGEVTLDGHVRAHEYLNKSAL